MTPYIWSHLSKENRELFKEMVHLVRTFPDVHLPKSRLLSCHMVCRILAERLFLPYKDGFFGKGCEHSWLVKDPYILDPYPVALMGGPILVVANYITLPWRGLYQEKKLEVVKLPSFKRDLARVREACVKEGW